MPQFDTVGALRTRLAGCDVIAGSLRIFITEDFDLEEITSSVVAISGDLVFHSTNIISIGVRAFKKLLALGGSLQIKNNQELVSVDGMLALHTARGLSIDANPSLKTITGISALQQLGQAGLSIDANGQLEDASGVTAHLLHVGGVMRVRSNPKLLELNAGRLSAVDNNLAVSSNERMKAANLTGLVHVAGHLEFSSLSRLAVFDLGSLEHVGQDLKLTSCFSSLSLDAILTLPVLQVRGGAVAGARLRSQLATVLRAQVLRAAPGGRPAPRCLLPAAHRSASPARDNRRRSRELSGCLPAAGSSPSPRPSSLASGRS